MRAKIPRRDVRADGKALPWAAGPSTGGEGSVVVWRCLACNFECDVARLAGEAEGLGRELSSDVAGARGRVAGDDCGAIYLFSLFF